MKFFFNLIISISTLYSLTCNVIDTDAQFLNSQVLVDDQYTMHWHFNQTDITIKCIVKTTGWFGFGLSPNGAMWNSDVVLAWISPDGKHNLIDAHVGSSDGKHRPIPDKFINWQLLFMQQTDGYLTAIFTRKLKVCGQADSGEVNIEVLPTQPIIYSWGEEFDDEMKSFPKYHGTGHRGTKVMNILGALNEPVNIDMNKVETFDFNTSVSLI